MNKYLFITLLIIGAGAVGYLFMRTGNTPNEPVLDTHAIDGDIAALEGTLQEEDTARGAGLSCNAVASEGVCIELTGSLYQDVSMAQMACAENGALEQKTCPASPFGGCKTGGGTNMEMTSYLYPNAENEMDAESIQYAEMACNSTPMAEWVHND